MRRAKALLVLFAIGACQRTEDRATEAVIEKVITANGREAKVNIDREKRSITIDLGGPSVPSGWPAEVPIYPSASKAKIEREAEGKRWLAITTSDPVAPLERFYREELTSKGWQVDRSEGPPALQARKGSKTFLATFRPREGKGGSLAKIEYGEGA